MDFRKNNWQYIQNKKVSGCNVLWNINNFFDKSSIRIDKNNHS